MGEVSGTGEMGRLWERDEAGEVSGTGEMGRPGEVSGTGEIGRPGEMGRLWEREEAGEVGRPGETKGEYYIESVTAFVVTYHPKMIQTVIM